MRPVSIGDEVEEFYDNRFEILRSTLQRTWFELNPAYISIVSQQIFLVFLMKIPLTTSYHMKI